MQPILPSRAFLPVIHVEDTAQALRNVRRAFENGAHGIFLINHRMLSQYLLVIYDCVRKAYPDKWIGLNMLDLEPEQALLMIPEDANGLWVDSIHINLKAQDPVQNARRYAEIHRSPGARWRGMFFGGVAFKYQPQFGDPAKEAELAAPFVDVVTTSGDGTGSAPSVLKIRTMHEAIPKTPLAIASGMTPENVRAYCAHVQYFLVATGISDSHTELNPARTRAFADALQSAP